MLADDFVLTHKSAFVDAHVCDIQSAFFVKTPSKNDRGFTGKFDPSKVCNYCWEKGHWKLDCPVLKNKQTVSRSPVKSAASVAPVLSEGIGMYENQKPDVEFLSSYSPFITEGRVSLVGEKEIPVKILRDTGSIDSFILESVLLFSSQSHTGESVLIRGIGLNVLSVPLHKVRLQSELNQGEVVMGVRPALPIEGVHIILGNELVGERVWADSSVFPIVTANNKNETEPSHDATYVVTRAMKQREDELIKQKEIQLKKACTDLFVPDLSALSFPVSAEELWKEQWADSSLDELFQYAVTQAEMGNLARGYVVSDGVLLRKWIPHKGDFVGDPVFQVVVPVKFRRTMIEIAHDQSGQKGVRKIYDRLLQYYFWPHLKRDISVYIKKCKTCQLTSKPNQVLKPAPLKPYYEDKTKVVPNKISAHSVLSSVAVGGERTPRCRTQPVTGRMRWMGPWAGSCPVLRAPCWRTAACCSWPCCPSSLERSNLWAAPRARVLQRCLRPSQAEMLLDSLSLPAALSLAYISFSRFSRKNTLTCCCPCISSCWEY